ncbi:MAG: hypothetical protein ABI612_20920 [Betaproteobacteria bacterium]
MQIHIPITLYFRDGEVIVADIAFDYEPTSDEVRRATNNVAVARGAKKVVLPVEWR